MGNIIKLEETRDTPQVIFNADTNEFSISGRSMPEDAVEFYHPLIAWMKDYVKNPNPVSELQISLQYINSSSVKQVFDIFKAFEEIVKSGREAKIIWFYGEDDDLMEMKGSEFRKMLNIPFELKIC